MKIKILIIQTQAVPGNKEANIYKAEKLLKESGDCSADLIILPELWATGWDCPNFENYAEDIKNSKVVEFLKSIAVKFNSNVIGGSSILKKSNEKIRNTSVILDRKGNIITTYDKFHLFSLRGESEGNYLESGETPVIAETDIGKIGISTCYDIRFPEMFRLYAFNETDLMVNMAAWPLDFIGEYEILSRARAIENQTYFINASLTGKINDKFNFGGNSMVIDFQGKIIDKLNREEKVLTSCIDLDKMKEYRQQMPILNDTKKQYKILER